MQDDLSEDVRVSDVQPILEVPTWLKIRLSPELTDRGRELADTLIRAVILISAPKAPASMSLRFDIAQGGVLSIRCFSSPQLDDVADALLAKLVTLCEEIHNRGAVDQVKQERNEELPRFLVDDRDAEFDWLWRWRSIDLRRISTCSSSREISIN